MDDDINQAISIWLYLQYGKSWLSPDEQEAKRKAWNTIREHAEKALAPAAGQ